MARISSASCIRNLGHLCGAVGGGATLSRLLTRLVCPSCQFGIPVFLCLPNASKTSKTWKNVMCVGKIQWIYRNYSALWKYWGKIWRLRQLHTWCVLCIFASVLCGEAISQHLFNLDVVLINTLQGCNVFLGLTWHVDHDSFHIGSTHTSTFLGLTAVNYGRGLKWQLHVC